MTRLIFVSVAARGALLASIVLAQSGEPAAPSPAPVASPAPATAPAPGPMSATAPARPEVPDFCKMIFDDYGAAKERTRFLASAGVENEMDEKAFGADKDKGGGFVRPFDRWEVILRFDKSGNKKIDWFEAEAYRQEFRKRLLAAFDVDKDGKLSDLERERANRALARGWTWREDGRGAAGGDPRNPAGGPGDALGGGAAGAAGGREAAGRAWARRLDRQEVLKKYDKDADGQLSDEERAAAIKDFEEEQRQETIKKYDKDGDGQLNDEERVAMREDMRRQAQPWKKMTDKIAARLFETDEDGQLTEIGKTEVKEFQKKFQELGKELEVRFLDQDGDGNVSDEERKQAQAQWRFQALRLIGMSIKYMDADGDGKVTAEEREAFTVRLQQGLEKWVNKFVTRYDTSGDGKFGPEQRAALLKGVREEIDKRIKKYDTEGKGRLTPSQTLDMVDDFAKEIGLSKPKPVPASAPAEEE